MADINNLGPDAGDENETANYLDDEAIRHAIELLFYAYRDHTADPDALLQGSGFGRAHHRAIHFVGRNPGITVAELLAILGITKQSLARVLKQLVTEGYIEQVPGEKDRRQRLLHLTEKGMALERRLSAPQRERHRRAFQAAGPEAVDGYCRVLRELINEWDRDKLPVMKFTSDGDDGQDDGAPG